MFTPLGLVIAILLVIRLWSFFPKVVELANVKFSEPSSMQPPKGFFAKREHKKRAEKAEVDYIGRKFRIYFQYFFCLILIFFFSLIGGYSLMIPIAMLVATAFDQELFPANTPIIGRDQKKYLQIKMRYAQSNVHLIVGADGLYDQKLVRKHYLRKYIFLYRWFTKKTQALVDLENSMKTDSDAVKDFIKTFFIVFLKLTLLILPLDIIIWTLTGYQPFSDPSDFFVLFCSCFFGIFGVIAGTGLMRKYVATEYKVTLNTGGNTGSLSTTQSPPSPPSPQTTGVLPASPPPPTVRPAPPVSMSPRLPPAPPPAVVPASPPPPAVRPAPPVSMSPTLPPAPPPTVVPASPPPPTVRPAPPVSMSPTLPPAPPASASTSQLPNPEVSDMPPLPPGGLPSGWTIEQWKHYGKEWYERQR